MYFFRILLKINSIQACPKVLKFGGATALEQAKSWGAKWRAMYLNLEMSGGHNPSSPPGSNDPQHTVTYAESQNLTSKFSHRFPYVSASASKCYPSLLIPEFQNLDQTFFQTWHSEFAEGPEIIPELLMLLSRSTSSSTIGIRRTQLCQGLFKITPGLGRI